MSDYFGDRYWAQRFWPVHYFQGGTVDPNAMSAALAGAASLSATVNAIGLGTAVLSCSANLAATLDAADPGVVHVVTGGGYAPRRLDKPRQQRHLKKPKSLAAVAVLSGSSQLAARLTATATAAAALSRGSALGGTATASWLKADTEFWLIAA